MISRAFPALVLAVVAAAGGLWAAGLKATTLPDSGKIDDRETAAFRALDRYVQEAHRSHSAGEAAVPFRIEAELPKFHKHGLLRGLKVITGAGRTVYTRLHFVGDNMIRTTVIARFLSVDRKVETVQAAEIAPDNYRFSYKGIADYNRRAAYVFGTKPKRKRVGLFRGELWIDAETARPLREWGEFVKSPSVFVRKLYFVRDYDSSSANPNVRRIIVRLQAAVVGPVELTMWLDRAEPDDAGGG